MKTKRFYHYGVYKNIISNKIQNEVNHKTKKRSIITFYNKIGQTSTFYLNNVLNFLIDTLLISTCGMLYME